MSKKASASGNKKKASFEQSLDRLERIVDKLEGGEASLDESLALYEEGVKTLSACHAVLEDAEKKIETLVTDSRGLFKAKPFTVENDGA